MIEFSSSDEAEDLEPADPAPKRARANPVVEPRTARAVAERESTRANPVVESTRANPVVESTRPSTVRVRAEVREAPHLPTETLYFDLTPSQRVRVKEFPFMLEAVSLSTVELLADDDRTARWTTGMDDWTYDKTGHVTLRRGREGSFKHGDRQVTVDLTIV